MMEMMKKMKSNYRLTEKWMQMKPVDQEGLVDIFVTRGYKGVRSWVKMVMNEDESKFNSSVLLVERNRQF